MSDLIFAHHALVVALPAFVPAIVVVGVVLYIARKDRREEREENAQLKRHEQDFGQDG